MSESKRFTALCWRKSDMQQFACNLYAESWDAALAEARIVFHRDVGDYVLLSLVCDDAMGEVAEAVKESNQLMKLHGARTNGRIN